MGEVAYFLKKARQNIEHAEFSLSNIDFSRSVEMLENAKARISDMEKLTVDMRAALDMAEQAAILQSDEESDKEQEE